MLKFVLQFLKHGYNHLPTSAGTQSVLHVVYAKRFPKKANLQVEVSLASFLDPGSSEPYIPLLVYFRYVAA